jgi:hypothetical protein
MIPTGMLQYSEKSASSVTSSTIRPAWTGLGLNPGLRGEKCAENTWRLFP